MPLLSHLPPLNLQVTGGSSGIGKSIAMECYRQGAFITLVARDECQEKLGPVDMLVNCAGTSFSGKFEEVEVERFRSLMEVNYLGSVYPTRAVIATMKERRMGRIMFVSSQAGQIGLFGYTAYSPS
ncbi:3-ketodihydrosphingosine reductase-like [Oncorhynchus nerka]|uniref:3-ketodihydrosphingosine reductase-like n=1 Tax=Oncorhynchus nerka TaxID=8023 RepID=UPI0031B8662A